MTVSVSVSDTLSLNTCPHYFTSRTNLVEKGTALLFLLTGISAAEHWGAGPREPGWGQSCPGRSRPAHPRLLGLGAQTEFKTTTYTGAASTQDGWQDSAARRCFCTSSSPIAPVRAPREKLGPVSSCWAGWGHKPEAVFGCLQPYIHMHYVEAFAFQGCCYFDLYNPWKK